MPEKRKTTLREMNNYSNSATKKQEEPQQCRNFIAGVPRPEAGALVVRVN
jgi:hypothetical protein